jgi:hypothetical protein
LKIPKTIKEATSRLATLEDVATSTGWERAAIVYAFTYDGTGGPNRSKTTTVLTPREFAALGIVGLKSDTTVREYRNAWKAAIKSKHTQEVKPGGDCTLPALDWPPSTHPGNSIARIAHRPESVEKVISLASPETKVETVVNLLTDPEVEDSKEVRKAIAEHSVKQAKKASVDADNLRYEYPSLREDDSRNARWEILKAMREFTQAIDKHRPSITSFPVDELDITGNYEPFMRRVDDVTYLFEKGRNPTDVAFEELIKGSNNA